MSEKKLREAEKSPMTISFNVKEESLLKKKIGTLDSMKKQAADSMTLDQKVLYNRFTLRLRRSELAHARLIGNKVLVKCLTNSIFSNFNTSVNDGTGEELRNILKNGKPLRAASAPCRPMSKMSYMSDSDQSFGGDIDSAIGHNFESKRLNCKDFTSSRKFYKPHQRFSSAPGTRQAGGKQVQFHISQDDENKMNLATAVSPRLQNTPMGKSQASLKEDDNSIGILKLNQSLETVPAPKYKDLKEPRSESTRLLRKRPKSTTFSPLPERTKLASHSLTKDDVAFSKGLDFEGKVKQFVEKVNSMQQQAPVTKDYYSQRILDGARKREHTYLRDKEEEQRQWLPVGLEANHRSVTLKKLDQVITRNDIPLEILFMEQYNLVLTKENLTVRNWLNNNPYFSAIYTETLN